MQIDSTSNPTLPHSSSLAAAASCCFDFSAGYAVFMRGCTSHPYSGYHYASTLNQFLELILFQPCYQTPLDTPEFGLWVIYLVAYPSKDHSSFLNVINSLQVGPVQDDAGHCLHG